MLRATALAFVLLLPASVSHAQPSDTERYTLLFRGVPLARALETIAHAARIDLVYTSEHVDGKYAYCSGRDMSSSQLLDCVLKGSGLEYVRSSSGAFVLINALSAPPELGHLAGTIVDDATGAPLPHANVLLADSRTGTTTNDAGLFTFGSVVSGPHRVVVTYVGYETAVDSVWINPGVQRRVRIALKAAETTMAPIVINGLTQRLPSSGLGALAVSGEFLNASSYSSTTDISRGLSSVTGVSTQQPLADLHIQASSAGEHVTLLDGAPVRDPVSLGRYLSAFSPLALGRATVHKAGFGASLGSNLAGVVAVEHALHDRDDRLLTLSVDPLSMNGRITTSIPLPNGVDASIMTAARSSVWSTYQDPSMRSLLRSWHSVDPLSASSWVGEEVTSSHLSPTRHRPEVAFSDLHAGVRLRLSPFRTLYVSGYRARSHLSAELAALYSQAWESEHLLLTSDRYDWTNWVTQVRHSWLLGARSTLSTQVLGSWNDSDYAYYGLYAPSEPVETSGELAEAVRPYRDELEDRPAAEQINRIRELTFRTEFSHSLSPRHHVDAGADLTRTGSRLVYGNPFVNTFLHEASMWHVAGYLESRHSLGLRTVIEPGVRLTYLPPRKTVYAEPRLAVRYDGRTGPLGTFAARVAGGVYRQFINQIEITSVGATSLAPSTLIWLPMDGTLSPPRAFHVATDVLLMPDERWTLSLEAFRKWQQRLPAFDYASLLTMPRAVEGASLRQDEFVASASGDVYGGGFRARYDGDRLDPSLAYSYSRATRRYGNRFEGAAQPVPWHAPHRLEADLTVLLHRGLDATLSWQSDWGRRWGLRRSYYDFIGVLSPAGAYGSFDLKDPSSLGAPPYHRLDAGLSYQVRFEGVDAELRFFVTNVLDRSNVFDWSLERDDGDVTSIERTLPGRHLFLSLRLGY